MRRPGLMPIASAVMLTVAAGLSIAAEHAYSSHPVAHGVPLALPAPQGTGDTDIGSNAADVSAASQAKAGATAAKLPAVGSRALTGNDEECPAAGKQP
jgi:hypothetical protein